MVDRRDFLKLGVGAAGSSLLPLRAAAAQQVEELKRGGEGYSHLSGVKLKAVPSVCGQCPSRCAIIGYVDDGRVVKIEGQPQSIRNKGLICAKGQSGAAKVYDPDRILFPLRRIGKRGGGQWRKISWNEALGELSDRLKIYRDEGKPEKFVFHHGWISASAKKLIVDIFLPAYGTGSVIDQTCQGQSARWTAHELTWGPNIDNWDIENSRFVLNFGSNLLEADTNFVSLATRLANSAVDNRLMIVTFDVRLSNTAANSDLWLPLRPATDLAVVLAMCNVVMGEDLYRGEGERFLDFCLVNDDLNASRGEKIAALKNHLAEYTPDWAEKISGVPARRIGDIARRFAAAKPACVISSRGAVSHYNGVETERAIQMLAAITGNIDNPGGRCRAVVPQWRFPDGPENIPPAGRLSFLEGAAGHRVLHLIGESGERPGVYMWYHHNPAYANADTGAVLDVLKDHSLLPYTVAVTPFYDETAALADLILPDATYLERFDIEAGVSPGQIAEYSLRQPLTPPLGEARDFNDVCLELAERMGFPLGFKSSESFIRKACKLTPAVRKKARGFRGMKKRGVWHDKKAAPAYYGYREKVPAGTLTADGVTLDHLTGVYWKSAAAGREYIGQKIGDDVYAGFDPGKIGKTGLFELYSPALAALPAYAAVPGHVEMREDQLILTTFKVNVQALSNTGNSGWLSEIHHENPAWINPQTAKRRGISDGDAIVITSGVGRLEATAKVTPTVAPGVVAVAAHLGRREGGRYASGKRAPFALDDARHDDYRWWKPGGANANLIIPDNPEPVGGQQSWMDTVVTVEKI